MISFDSDDYTCFPSKEFENKCVKCEGPIVIGLSNKGHITVNHLNKMNRCNHNTINRNYGFFIIHIMTDKPYPRPMSTCPKCGKIVVYMWDNRDIGKWYHLDKTCGLHPDIFIGHTVELATILLLFHLIEGKSMKVRGYCEKCRITHSYKLPKLSYIEKGFPIIIYGKTFVISLCCFNRRERLVAMIQIGYYSNEVSDFCKDEGIFIYRLYIHEIIKKLDKTHLKQDPIFENKSPINCNNY